MTDLSVGAVGWIESLTATDEAFEFRFEAGEFTAARPNLAQLGGEQGADVGAGCGTFFA